MQVEVPGGSSGVVGAVAGTGVASCFTARTGSGLGSMRL